MAFIGSWIRKYRKHVLEVGLGFALYELFNLIYDFGFYPFALAYWGYAKGIAIAAAGSLIQCAVMFWLYEHMQVDWLKAHAARSLADKESRSRFERFLSWVGSEKRTLKEKLAGVMMFIGLLSFVDPLIVAVWFQRNHFRGGLGFKDWQILVAAVAVANALWFLKTSPFVAGFKLTFFGHL